MLKVKAQYIHHTATEKEFTNAKTQKTRKGWVTEVSLFAEEVGKTFVMRMIGDTAPAHLSVLKPMDPVYLQLGVKRGDWEDEISLTGIESAVPSTVKPATASPSK